MNDTGPCTFCIYFVVAVNDFHTATIKHSARRKQEECITLILKLDYAGELLPYQKPSKTKED